MYGFSSYHWDVSALGAEDRRAVAALDEASPALPSAGYATHDPASLLAAYRVLLRSDDVRARGVALDQYRYADAQERWGSTNPFTEFDAEVLAEARAMLATTPEPGVPIGAQPHVVACWSTGMGVLSGLGDDDDSDLPRILELLDAAVADVDGLGRIVDQDLFWAIQVRLVDAGEQSCRRVGARLAAFIGDDAVPTEWRTLAIGSLFGDDRFAVRLGQEAVLAGLLDHGDIRLAVQAAWALAGRPEYTALVRRSVAAWPDDAPYPASEVRRDLDDADRLAQARSVLAAAADPRPPVDAAQLCDALDAVEELGDTTDIPRLLAVFDDPATASADDVTERLVQALERRLPSWGDLSPCRAAGTTLAGLFTREDRPTAVRVRAIRPLWTRSARFGQDDALAALLDHDDLHLSMAAAHALAGRQEHLPRVRATVDRWPDDAPPPAGPVRRALADTERLAWARDLLTDLAGPGTPPVDEVGLYVALDTVYDLGDGTDAPLLLAVLRRTDLAAMFAGTDPDTADELGRMFGSALREHLEHTDRQQAGELLAQARSAFRIPKT